MKESLLLIEGFIQKFPENRNNIQINREYSLKPLLLSLVLGDTSAKVKEKAKALLKIIGEEDPEERE